jgi:hypothetical protein
MKMLMKETMIKSERKKTNPFQVVFFEFQPRMGPLCYLIGGLDIKAFDHQTFAVVLD